MFSTHFTSSPACGDSGAPRAGQRRVTESLMDQPMTQEAASDDRTSNLFETIVILAVAAIFKALTSVAIPKGQLGSR